ncbi:DUF2125 domain-containing protein [Amorphus coralli]|uniref:DUF2125 domain-containing protein n=1 Tax=Amorphus coralli TaxID=340680 RepID=UPI00036D918D|nr:DUF2125 domain-containing protein [Amorphus coralli]
MAKDDQTAAKTAPPRTRRRFLLLGIAVVAVVMAWSVFWFIAAAYAERTFDKVVDDAVADGVALDCVNRRIEGFPFRIELHCAEGTSLTLPDAKVTLSGLSAVALIYNPRHVIAGFGSPAVISNTDFPETQVEWERARASVAYSGAGLERFSLSIDNPAVAPEGLPPVTATLAEMHLRTDPKTGDAVDVALRLDGAEAVPGQPAVDFRTVAVVRNAPLLVAALQGVPMLGQAAVAGLPIDLTQLSLAAGGTKLSAAGDLTVRPDGALDGAVDLAVTTGEDGLPYLDVFLPPDQADALRGIVQSVLNFGRKTQLDGEPARAFPLSISSGRVSAGLFPIGRIPPIPLGPGLGMP